MSLEKPERSRKSLKEQRERVRDSKSEKELKKSKKDRKLEKEQERDRINSIPRLSAFSLTIENSSVG